LKAQGLPLRLERAEETSPARAVAGALLAVALAMLLASVLFRTPEAGAWSFYRMAFGYAFANPSGLGATVHRAVYLLLCTLAFLVPLRGGLWNIGLPGQVYAGALASFLVALQAGARAGAGGAPSGFHWLSMPVAAALAGAVLGGAVGALRARMQVNEILVTMMLNSAMFWLVSDFIKEGGLLMSATAEGESFTLPDAFRPPLLLGLPPSAFLALAAAAAADFVFFRLAAGYRVRVFGLNPSAARYAGVDPVRVSLWVFVIGGAAAGLAGYHYFAAAPGLYKIPTNYGYYGDLSFYGIICALIARGSAVGAVPMALLFAGLTVGGRFAQGALRLPFGVDYAFLGLLMTTFVVSHLADRYRLTWRRPAPRMPAAVPSRPEEAG
jgi:simple sugar transport system permease protein